MIRKIVNIDEGKCTGCGICIPNCAEGALQIIDGKARLIKEIYCDGLGACLGDCPEDAISLEEREADEFDEAAVEEHLKKTNIVDAPVQHSVSGGCPGSAMRMIEREEAPDSEPTQPLQSQLGQWPVQLMLVPPAAPFLKGADIVICADCVPFAFADFHQTYLKNKAVLVGCPKLDDLSFYRQKLTEIFRVAQPSSITVLKMEVPCCGGIAFAAMEARNEAAPNCDIETHTIGIQGSVSCEKG
ncbi:ATP-binding protein [Candidatus Latescibacterota bacterium]